MLLKAGLVRWLPFVALIIIAAAFEPIRSGFAFSNQSCELLADQKTVLASAFNLRHLIAYGLLFLTAAIPLRGNMLPAAAMGIFVFSILLEIEQSFFVTGHCRSWDLIPNLLGIGGAAAVFFAARKIFARIRRSP